MKGRHERRGIVGYREPAQYDGVELGLDGLHQLRVEEVLTEAEGAAVAGAHAAQTSVPENKPSPDRIENITHIHTQTEEGGC